MISDDKNTKKNSYELPPMTIKAWAEADPYVEAGVYDNVVVKPYKKVLP